MRILLAQNSRYYPAHGGGDKSNRLLMEALAARGHACLVVARISKFGAAEHDVFLSELAARNVTVESADGGVVVFHRGGVEVHTVTNRPSLRKYFLEQVAAFRPDVILASTDDPAQLLLEPAVRSDARVVFLARATLALPFGPDCAFPSTAKTDMLRRADAIVGVSQYVADYIRRNSSLEAVHVPISLLDPGPYEPLGRFENEFVTMVNPCAVKGISIFLSLAERMPQVALCGRSAHVGHERCRPARARAALRMSRSCRRLIKSPSCSPARACCWSLRSGRRLGRALWSRPCSMACRLSPATSAAFLKPSWALTICFPVTPIAKYQEQVDEQMVPVAEVPAQDIGPWYDALHRLLSDRAHYEQLALDSRTAALRYADSLSVVPFEQLLEQTLQKSKVAAPETVESPADPLSQSFSGKAPVACAALAGREVSHRALVSVDSRIQQRKIAALLFPLRGRWSERLPRMGGILARRHRRLSGSVARTRNPSE